MEIVLLSFCVLISAILSIVFKQNQRIKYYAVSKPITTILIIVIAVLIHLNIKSVYTLLVIFSLLFSLLGDIFLVNKNKYLLHGLFSFLIAHIGFTVAFSSIFSFNFNPIPLIILILIGGSYFMFLKASLNKYSIPVALYLTVIIIMNWQAIGLVFSSNQFVFFGIAVASLLFSFSDSIIAYNKFKRPFKIAEILILSTYWIAIYIFTIAGTFIS